MKMKQTRISFPKFEHNVYIIEHLVTERTKTRPFVNSEILTLELGARDGYVSILQMI